ncbi:hypothetical protein BKA62DRAFT_684439 [Auriculariales sp. MPI-PUGE-AT-0066]|nr:hypothetical protein BKA62DRAFT_684439 [Auriculariales sp. MPI-PUGE-AT-0066]
MSHALTAAVFAVGAAVGAGATALIHARRRIPLPTHASTPERVEHKAIMQVEPLGTHVVINPQLALAGEVLKYGNPGPISDLLTRKAYIAAYDRRLRHPAWTAEHLTLASLGKSALIAPVDDGEKGDRSKSQFMEDEAVPALFRAHLKDYFRSGYDRGHMVPAADAKFSQEAMNETFLLTNIAPQVGAGFNRHYWAYVEEWCRRLTGSFQDVYVFTIPLYLPQSDGAGKYHVKYEVIGTPPNVAVPTHFAKVVLTSRPSSPSTPDIAELAAGAFVLPNAEIPDGAPFSRFEVPIESVERAAGLQLFSDEVKRKAKPICQSTQCELIVRRFDDAQKNLAGRPTPRRAISAPPA